MFTVHGQVMYIWTGGTMLWYGRGKIWTLCPWETADQTPAVNVWWSVKFAALDRVCKTTPTHVFISDYKRHCCTTICPPYSSLKKICMVSLSLGQTSIYSYLFMLDVLERFNYWSYNKLFLGMSINIYFLFHVHNHFKSVSVHLCILGFCFFGAVYKLHLLQSGKRAIKIYLTVNYYYWELDKF